MSITISIYTMGVIVILALVGGFWIGRSVKWMMIDADDRGAEEVADDVEQMQEDMVVSERENKRIKGGSKRIPMGRAIGSPVGGTVRSISEGTRRGAMIQPEQGVLHAPVSGKITRLFPMGNKMLICSDAGVELLLRVGEMGDEMHSQYYRSHVVQNEIITKGKILLEFDMERMREEGVDTAVSVMVEAAEDYRDITVTQKEQVKSGEELLWVRENVVMESRLG